MSTNREIDKSTYSEKGDRLKAAGSTFNLQRFKAAENTIYSSD